MLQVYRKLFDILDPKERRRFLLLMVILVFVALADLVGLSAVLLLLNALSDTARLTGDGVLGWLYDGLGFDSLQAFQIFLAVGTALVIMSSIAIRALGDYAMIRYSTMRTYRIATRMLNVYLHRPYTWFLQRNSSEIARSVLSDVGRVVTKSLTPALRMLSSGLTALMIVGFLIAVDPMIALVAAGFLGGAYGVIYLSIRSKLLQISADLLEANKLRFRMAQEATGGFKELKLLGLEDSYSRRFDRPAARHAQRSALAQVLTKMPSYALQATVHAALIGLVLILLLRADGDLAAIIPTIGVFAFGTMRLMPAMQQIYGAFTSLRSSNRFLDDLHEEYTSVLSEVRNRPVRTSREARLPLTRELLLDNVSFAYPESQQAALRTATLRIPANASIGIVGGTGAGKTTLIDLILGLLRPDTGEIRVDGRVLDRGTLRAWQQSIGYVPQSIYLVDDTVRANIAFGMPPEKIDDAAVERAARLAALHEFITNDLPEGYHTMVGERGVRLSGGQRQRIGIARALYNDPDLLVFDEATSALDNITERVVMEAVSSMQGAKTIILIAHRLSTVRNCDVIHLMEQGCIAASGTYDELVAGSETFRRMASGI